MFFIYYCLNKFLSLLNIKIYTFLFGLTKVIFKKYFLQNNWFHFNFKYANKNFMKFVFDKQCYYKQKIAH